MIVKECAFLSRKGICNLITDEKSCETTFIDCQAIPITKCPYKMFIKGQISKQQLDEQVRKLSK